MVKFDRAFVALLALAASASASACGSPSTVGDAGDASRDADGVDSAPPTDAGRDASNSFADGPADALADALADAPGDAAAPTDAPPADPDPRLATTASITDVALFQATRVALFAQGALVASRNAPVVAERDALVRVYVAPGAGFTPHALTARLVISRAGQSDYVVQDTRPIATASRDDDPTSVFALPVPAGVMTTDARFAVALLDVAGAPTAAGVDSPARAPRDGSSTELGALTDAGGLNLVLVPLRWDSDGSGRLPDTSDAQIQRYRSLLLALYPLVHLRVTVHDPLPYDGGLTWTGNVDFGDVNQALVDLRQADNAPADAYYYALVEPAPDFDSYCGGSCVTGQSYVVATAADADVRVGSGVGWSGEDSAWTLAHEVGHEHGREHAPCSTRSYDPSFPYGGGTIGVWGYDPRDGTFYAPDTTTDFMGYCDVQWTSDYTYAAIFTRTREVNGAGASVRGGGGAPLPRSPYRFLRLGAPGGAAWGRAVALGGLPSGERYAVRWRDAGGATVGVATAARVRESESDATLLLVPAAPAGARWAMVEGGGSAVRVPLP